MPRDFEWPAEARDAFRRSTEFGLGAVVKERDPLGNETLRNAAVDAGKEEEEEPLPRPIHPSSNEFHTQRLIAGE